MAWARAVPDRGGALSLVMPSPGVPESLDKASTGAAGAGGAAGVSLALALIVSASSGGASLLLPARSTCLTVMSCRPSASGAAAPMVALQAPEALATAVPSRAPPS